jgi:hypothetical protein
MLSGELECELAMRSGRLDGQLAAHGFAADKTGLSKSHLLVLQS